jgi:hypothetical protein
VLSAFFSEGAAPEKREDEEQKEGTSLDHLKPPATPCTEESIPRAHAE